MKTLNPLSIPHSRRTTLITLNTAQFVTPTLVSHTYDGGYTETGKRALTTDRRRRRRREKRTEKGRRTWSHGTRLETDAEPDWCGGRGCQETGPGQPTG